MHAGQETGRRAEEQPGGPPREAQGVQHGDEAAPETEEAMVDGFAEVVTERVPDPLREIAEAGVAKARTRITLCESKAELGKQAGVRIHPSQKAIFLVNSPTSRAKEVIDQINEAREVIDANKLQRFVILVEVGRRVDLVGHGFAPLCIEI